MKKLPSWLLVALVAIAIAYAYETSAQQTVTATVSGCGADRCASLTVTGAAVPVTIAISNGAYFDQCVIGSTPANTTPPLGTNNDGLNATSLVITAPLTCDYVEFDGSPDQWNGGTLASGSTTASFVNNGGTWTATLTLAPIGNAKPVNLSWTPPTQNTDNTPYTNPGGYVIYYGLAQGAYTNTVRVTDPIAAMHDIQSLAPRTRYYFTMTAINTEGVESEFSNVVTIETLEQLRAPRPPGNVGAMNVEGVQIAYAIFQTLDSLALVPVGTVDDGTPCNPNVSVSDINGKLAFMVAKESVDFLPDTEAELVLTECVN